MNVARQTGSDALSRRLLGALDQSLPAESGATPVLLHHDYWYGNTIWQDGRLTGVVDWSSARLGDPRQDLALARTDLAVTLDLDAADELSLATNGFVARSMDFCSGTCCLRWLRIATWMSG
jgi:aminoglycoside phosphotransferase (APT) family kinase protein